MQNYHRHSSYSNILTRADSVITNEDYAKRAVELGHKVLSSVEHGWQGYYFEIYELAKKYNLKCVIGTEAYWVKDRSAKDRSNHHIIILARNNNGREAINDILSEANITGYYYRPRVDMELLLSLPADDVLITSACIAFSGEEDTENIITRLHNHFGDNFMLEVQCHNTERQKEWNSFLLDVSKKHDINLIAGLDSHYIYPEEAVERDNLLEARDIHYDDEEGWYMDYPSDDIVFQRFIEQGILSEAQIKSAMDNTDILLTFDDYDEIPIFNKDIKLPTLYPGETTEQKNKRYSKLITKHFKEYIKNVPEERRQEYFEGVKAEVQTYKDTGMCDYPLLDYAIVKDGIKHGGIITSTGRGSAVGFFTNTLCGFSSVDRFTSDIKLYPERFISTTRILETKSLPDIDLNIGTVEIFEESQKRILGEDHVAPMIAFGTLKQKAAFKIYAKSQNMEFELANAITKQISKYEEAVKNADDESKDTIDLYDYVDEKYKSYIDESKKYLGIISDKKKAPSAYLLYQGNIRREIGLIKCKAESSTKEYITCVIDGTIAENYKFLKNDLLKVDVALLIKKVFDRIGISQMNTSELINRVKNNKDVWNIYANGYTVGINQVEQEGSKNKCMKYKPQNVAELAAFVAAIRPGFKSMYKRFEKREDFSWGIPALDNLIRTEQLPVSFIFFQEQCMMVLNYAGFPMDECYGIIKAIAKKHPEKVKPLKARFLEGITKRLIEEENIDEKIAKENANAIWQIVNDNTGYAFNASHAYCMALDSLYQAWQKATYPYEFYEVLLQHFTDKGKKDKVSDLKKEMKKAFGIREGKYKFRNDHRKFSLDKENKCIYPSLSSIKNMNKKAATELYRLRDENYNTFIDLLIDLKDKTSINSRQLDILIKINFFSEFGNENELLYIVELFDMLYGKKQFNKDKLPDGVPQYLIEKYAGKETEKQYREMDTDGLLREMTSKIDVKKPGAIQKIQWEKECLGYATTIVPKFKYDDYYVVLDIKGYSNNILSLYNIKDGNTLTIKARNKKRTLPQKFDVIQVVEISVGVNKWRKEGNDFVRLDEKEDILSNWKVVKVRTSS